MDSYKKYSKYKTKYLFLKKYLLGGNDDNSDHTDDFAGGDVLDEYDLKQFDIFGEEMEKIEEVFKERRDPYKSQEIISKDESSIQIPQKQYNEPVKPLQKYNYEPPIQQKEQISKQVTQSKLMPESTPGVNYSPQKSPSEKQLSVQPSKLVPISQPPKQNVTPIIPLPSLTPGVDNLTQEPKVQPSKPLLKPKVQPSKPLPELPPKIQSNVQKSQLIKTYISYEITSDKSCVFDDNVYLSKLYEKITENKKKYDITVSNVGGLLKFVVKNNTQCLESNDIYETINIRTAFIEILDEYIEYGNNIDESISKYRNKIVTTSNIRLCNYIIPLLTKKYGKNFTLGQKNDDINAPNESKCKCVGDKNCKNCFYYNFEQLLESIYKYVIWKPDDYVFYNKLYSILKNIIKLCPKNEPLKLKYIRRMDKFVKRYNKKYIENCGNPLFVKLVHYSSILVDNTCENEHNALLLFLGKYLMFNHTSLYDRVRKYIPTCAKTCNKNFIRSLKIHTIKNMLSVKILVMILSKIYTDFYKDTLISVIEDLLDKKNQIIKNSIDNVILMYNKKILKKHNNYEYVNFCNMLLLSIKNNYKMTFNDYVKIINNNNILPPDIRIDDSSPKLFNIECVLKKLLEKNITEFMAGACLIKKYVDNFKDNLKTKTYFNIFSSMDTLNNCGEDVHINNELENLGNDYIKLVDKIIEYKYRLNSIRVDGSLINIYECIYNGLVCLKNALTNICALNYLNVENNPKKIYCTKYSIVQLYKHSQKDLENDEYYKKINKAIDLSKILGDYYINKQKKQNGGKTDYISSLISYLEKYKNNKSKYNNEKIKIKSKIDSINDINKLIEYVNAYFEKNGKKHVESINRYLDIIYGQIGNDNSLSMKYIDICNKFKNYDISFSLKGVFKNIGVKLEDIIKKITDKKKLFNDKYWKQLAIMEKSCTDIYYYLYKKSRINEIYEEYHELWYTYYKNKFHNDNNYISYQLMHYHDIRKNKSNEKLTKYIKNIRVIPHDPKETPQIIINTIRIADEDLFVKIRDSKNIDDVYNVMYEYVVGENNETESEDLGEKKYKDNICFKNKNFLLFLAKLIDFNFGNKYTQKTKIIKKLFEIDSNDNDLANIICTCIGSIKFEYFVDIYCENYDNIYDIVNDKDVFVHFLKELCEIVKKKESENILRKGQEYLILLMKSIQKVVEINYKFNNEVFEAFFNLRENYKDFFLNQ